MNFHEKDIIDYVLKSIIFISLIILAVIIINYTVKNFYLFRANTVNVFNDDNEESKEYIDEKYINTMMNTIVEMFNIQINGYEITVGDRAFGYVENKEKRSEVLKNICCNYLKELGINEKDVIKIEVNGDIEAKPYKIKVSELSEIGEISKEIYDSAIINDELIHMGLEAIDKENEVIEAPIVIEDDQDMLIGEEERIEGSNGQKTIYKKLSYNGLNIEDESVISEIVTIKPVATIIKRGIKNPYYSGTAFLLNPAEGGLVTSVFGEIRNSSYHKGVDIAKPMGEAVKCAMNGVVTFAGYNDGGYGNLIKVQHGEEMETYYAHLSEIYVSAGDKVNEGDIIGSIGSTGFSTGPHLHFELRVSGTPVDPEEYIIN